MAIEHKVAEVDNLTGGLDTFINPTEIEDSATPDCLNVIPTGKGAFKTRLGRTAHGGEITSTKATQGYFIYIKSDNTVQELVVVNGVLKLKNGENWDTISGGTFNASNRVCAVQLGDRLYFADGETALCYYNGTAIATTGVASAPTPSILIKFGRRLYANDITNQDRVYYGGALKGDGAADNTGNFSSLTPSFGGYYGYGQGKVVTSMAKLGTNYLVVGLKDSVHRITPVADTGLSVALDHADESLSDSVGIANHFAVDNLENDLIFPSFTDIYLLGEVANYSSWRTRVISTKVSKHITGITNTRISKTAGIYSPVEKKYYFAYSSSSTFNNKVLVYDNYYKSWWMYDNWEVAAWLEMVDATSNHYLLYASDNPSDSYCYEVNTGASDDGDIIDWYWYSKTFDYKGFDILKKFKRWAGLFGAVFGNITVTIYIDETPAASTLSLGTATTTSSGCGSRILGSFVLGLETNDTDSATTTLSNDYRWRKIPRPNEGTKVQFKFAGGGTNESAQIEKIRVYYNQNTRKKDRDKKLA